LFSFRIQIQEDLRFIGGLYIGIRATNGSLFVRPQNHHQLLGLAEPDADDGQMNPASFEA
jgi:hypothetical protein